MPHFELLPVIPMQAVESSQIHSIGHDAETNTLAIRFFRGYDRDQRPGSLYHYRNFDQAAFEAFRDAESKGKHFGKHIKPFPDQYPYTKVEDAPASAAA
jgi:hypothetical protein